jgi:nitrogen fixation/metabolism regulation signal transduction histidine kinase
VRRFEVTIVAALLLASVLPLAVSLAVVDYLVASGWSLTIRPEVEQVVAGAEQAHRDALTCRGELHEETLRSIALDPALQRAAATGDAAGARAVLAAALDGRPHVEALEVRDAAAAAAGSDVLAAATRADDGRAGGDVADGTELVEVARALGGATEAGIRSYVLAARYGIPARHDRDFQRVGETGRRIQWMFERQDTYRKAFTLMAFLFLVLAAVLAVTLGVFLSRSVTRRVTALVGATHRVSGGDLEFQLEAPGRDEVSDLIRSFNSMVRELRDSRERIGYLEKISAWQEVARRLAHEIKNPLTPINLAVQELQRRYKGEDAGYKRVLDESVSIVEEEVATLKRQVEAFSAFAKLPTPQFEASDLAEVVESAVRANAHLGDEADIVWTAPAGPAAVSLDRLMIRQVVGNLLRNAVQAARGHAARPRVRLTLEVDEARARAVLTVEDNGPGVPACDRRRVFEPYFTTKEQGTGLGLAIVRKIVLMHGGEVTVEAAAPEYRGAAFRVEMPLAAAPGEDA